MIDRLEMMIGAIKQPCVLRLKLIKNKSPGEVMFVFEGDDDYDFYFHALNSYGFSRNYSHINGSGKDQSIALYSELESESSEYLNNTYFFVDQDYSLFCHDSENMLTLPFYAIENPLSDDRVIKHFLTSTFKFDDSTKKILDSVMAYYASAKESFYNEMREISIQLYMSRVLGLKVQFPCNEAVFSKIDKGSVSLKISSIPEIHQRILSLSDDEIGLYQAVCALNRDQLTRGKYVYHFVSEWLIRIKKYIHGRIDNFNVEVEKDAIKNNGEKLSTAIKKMSKPQYDHKDLTIARLVPACRKIPEVERFLAGI